MNLHNRVHVRVGGQMATGVSPNDPVYRHAAPPHGRDQSAQASAVRHSG